jgi:hypothetical protein
LLLQLNTGLSAQEIGRAAHILKQVRRALEDTKWQAQRKK